MQLGDTAGRSARGGATELNAQIDGLQCSPGLLLRQPARDANALGEAPRGRQALEDAQFLWEFADVGTDVWVL